MTRLVSSIRDFNDQTNGRYPRLLFCQFAGGVYLLYDC